MAATTTTCLAFKTKDIIIWKQCLDAYEKVFTAFCDKKSKDKLKKLDVWFREDFGSEIKKNNPHQLKTDDLTKLMEWKLSRGKFRPRLAKRIAENNDEDVIRISQDAFKSVGDAKQAIEILCQLRAVGPATSSAILTAYDPENYAFMADEAVALALPGEKIQYTLKFYLKYLEEMRAKSKELTELDTEKWTPRQVELALWTSKFAAQMKLTIPLADETETPSLLSDEEEVPSPLVDEIEEVPSPLADEIEEVPSPSSDEDTTPSDTKRASRKRARKRKADAKKRKNDKNLNEKVDEVAKDGEDAKDGESDAEKENLKKQKTS